MMRITMVLLLPNRPEGSDHQLHRAEVEVTHCSDHPQTETVPCDLLFDPCCRWAIAESQGERLNSNLELLQKLEKMKGCLEEGRYG